MRRRRRQHTGRPDCETCGAAIGAAGAQAFRQARAEARAIGVGRGAHVPGQHPVADRACEAAERAEAAVAVCYAPIGAREGADPGLDGQVLVHLPGPVQTPLTAAEVARAAGLPRQRVSDALRGLTQEGLVQRTGEGRRSAPYRYRRAAVVSAKPGQERSGARRRATGRPGGSVSANASEGGEA